MTKTILIASTGLFFAMPAQSQDVYDLVEHRFAENNGVRIHYVTIGEGPLIVMIHGFPDYWYSWRRQMPALAERHQVVAMDMRGYNRSDKPVGVENYSMELLVGDVAAVIRHAGHEQATVVGHDWGGAVAWTLAMVMPDVVERLIILNLPHPQGLARELARNPPWRSLPSPWRIQRISSRPRSPSPRLPSSSISRCLVACSWAVASRRLA